MRNRVSLLLEHGHAAARHYPLHMLFREAAVIEQRLNHAAITNAVLTRMAVASLLDKEAGKQFTDTIKKLQ